MRFMQFCQVNTSPMRKNSIYLLLALFITIFASLNSCRKSTAELPAANLSPIVREFSVTDNNLEQFKLIFRQQKTQQYDSIKVYLRNTSGQQISAVRLIIEVCKGSKGGYDDCRLQPQINIDTIAASESERLVYTFVNDGTTLSDARITIGLISINGSNHALAGVYSGGNSFAEFFADTSYKQSAFLRGYVLSNGQATFHLKGPDTLYDINGNFSKNNGFTGLMTRGNGILETSVDLVPTQIDSTTAIPVDTSGGGLRFGLKLRRPLSNDADSLYLQLKK